MRAYSVHNVLQKKFTTLDFAGKWLRAVGTPELSGTWMVYGPPKNGKTSFAMQLAKYMCGFKRVAYNSVEEGVSLTMQLAMERVGMSEVSGFVLLDKEPLSDLIIRLKKRKSPDVVVIDSVQFAELTFKEYKQLKSLFPNKVFIYVSHIQGTQPEGSVAKRIWRDSNLYFRVEGFRAFPVSRYGGGDAINVSDELAHKHWGLELEVKSCPSTTLRNQNEKLKVESEK